MDRRAFFGLFVFLILIFGIFLVSSEQNTDKVDGDVYEVLEENEEVPVKIKLEKSIFFDSKNKVKKNIDEEDLLSETKNEMFVSVDADELEEIKSERKVERVSFAPQYSISLDDSVPLINASVVWPVNFSSQNITGINETICIIDTGINFSHVDLIGKNKTCIINCWGGEACVEDCSLGDNNGHGTHVAGITAANGNIEGVAVGASLIGVKVLDENGDANFSTGTTDIKNAIDWCVANRVAHNISIISMSLGTTTLYTNYCDATFSSTLTKAVNNATLYNISVVVATGNAGSITQISSPACIRNSTAVGSIGNDDSTFAYNRNSITDLMAPGGILSNSAVCSPGSMNAGRICSTYNDGAYIAFAGTSMAAPHVAGAFALFRQFFRLQNGRVPTPSEIESEFNSTAKQINDSSGTGLNFSRIDVFSAIQSIDTSNPVVSLISPTNNTVQFTKNVTFQCSANDVQLDNVTLYVWNSTGVYNNTEIIEVSGVNGNLESNITDMSYGTYTWNCLAYDENNNFSFATENNTLTIGQISTSLVSPSDNSFVNTNQTYNCSAETEPTKLLTNITYYIWNSTDDLVYNVTEGVGGASNSSEFSYNFTYEDEYVWNCLIYNNESENDWASNFTITYDLGVPGIENVSSGSITASSAIVSWDVNESTNSSINYGTTTVLGTESTNASLATSHSLSLSGLSASTTYYYNVTSCDSAGNCFVNGTNSFTTSAAPAGDTGGSGGGGGGSVTTMTYIPSLAETTTGYTKSLSKDDKIKVTLFDGGNVQHTMTLDYIGTNSVNLTIRSDPITLSLGVGQSAKLNLSSAEYYDLYIKLNSITNNKADLVIQTIKEKMSSVPEITGDVVSEDGEKGETEVPDNGRRLKETFIYALGLVLVVIGVIVLLRKKSEKKKGEKTKKEYKKKFESMKPTLLRKGLTQKKTKK
jgi:subtilisin family serine protease